MSNELPECVTVIVKLIYQAQIVISKNKPPVIGLSQGVFDIASPAAVNPES